MTTNNYDLIGRLTALCDTDTYAADQKLSAYSVILAMYVRAKGVLYSVDQPAGWLALEGKAEAIVTEETDVEPGSDAWLPTLGDVWKIVNDPTEIEIDPYGSTESDHD